MGWLVDAVQCASSHEETTVARRFHRVLIVDSKPLARPAVPHPSHSGFLVSRSRKTAASLIYFALLLIGVGFSDASAGTTNFGFSVIFNHSAAYTESTVRTEESDAGNINGNGIKVFSYTRDLSVGTVFGLGDAWSELRFGIEPGHLKLYWLGQAETGNGDTSQATVDLRARMAIQVVWNETFTIENVFVGPGADVEIEVSHGLAASLSGVRTLQDSAALFAQTQFSTPTVDWTIAGESAFPHSQQTTNDYQPRFLTVKSGEQITLSQIFRASGQSYAQLLNGAPPLGEHESSRMVIESERSHRVGIRGITPGTRIISASGHVYPLHAMSPEAVQRGLASLHIKSAAYNPLTGMIEFAVDAIPGASYILEKSTDLRTWRTVSTPQIPPNFQAITLMDTPVNEPQAFWRVRATPL